MGNYKTATTLAAGMHIMVRYKVFGEAGIIRALPVILSARVCKHLA
jgi:hypothetical protein